MTNEATMQRDEHDGLMPKTDGWFVLNVGECAWAESAKFGRIGRLESPDARFPEVGMNVHVLEPGQPACHYHRENCQEDFLVLFGECKVIIENEERPLKAWDLVHCPPGVDHVFVGAGSGPCAIFMIGDRKGDAEEITYPRNELAAKYDASAARETNDPKESYAGIERPKPIPNPWARLLEGWRRPSE